MKEATVIYISPLVNNEGKHIAYNLMSDESDYKTKYFKWPIDEGEIEYHSVEDRLESDTVEMRSIGHIIEANFHSYEWGKDVTEKRFGEKLRAWKKDAKTYEVKIVCPEVPYQSGVNIDDGLFRGDRLNYLHDCFEYGITYNLPGMLLWGDGSYLNTYYINCYGGVKSETSPADDGYINSSINTIDFYAPVPWWQRIFKKERFGGSERKKIIIDDPYIKDYEEGYDYYPYDYLADLNSSLNIHNTNSIGSRYYLTIYGPAQGPEIKIQTPKKTNALEISFPTVNIPDGAEMVVNSIDKTVLMTKADGTVINCFGARKANAEGYLWDRVAYGINNITTNGAFNFLLELVEERSEPKWPMV